jgi:hypothetical protein
MLRCQARPASYRIHSSNYTPVPRASRPPSLPIGAIDRAPDFVGVTASKACPRGIPSASHEHEMSVQPPMSALIPSRPRFSALPAHHPYPPFCAGISFFAAGIPFLAFFFTRFMPFYLVLRFPQIRTPDKKWPEKSQKKWGGSMMAGETAPWRGGKLNFSTAPFI